MEIDITSDLHLDFWVSPTTTKSYRSMRNFIKGIIPENPSKVLVIAGDIGHYNYQNEQAFKVLRETYDHVCWVFGNHDLYLITHSMRKKFKNSSLNRLNNMIECSNRIDGVHYLGGTFIELDGVKIGGSGGWYDYSYGLNNFGNRFNKEMIHQKWKDYMNDWNLIKWEDSSGPAIFNPLKFAEVENAKFERLVTEGCDLIISHIGPCHGRLEWKYQALSTSFYYFDGEEYLYNLDENTTWLYGHTHSQFDYKHKMGCRMITNPLGYPKDIRTGDDNVEIRTITI